MQSGTSQPTKSEQLLDQAAQAAERRRHAQLPEVRERAIKRVSVGLAVAIGIALVTSGLAGAIAIYETHAPWMLRFGPIAWALAAFFYALQMALSCHREWVSLQIRVVERVTVRELPGPVVEIPGPIREVPGPTRRVPVTVPGPTRILEKEVEVRVEVPVPRATPMKPEQEETDVYRLYDGEDVLLYVGIGTSALDRWRDHAATKDWWPEVAHHRTQRYPYRGQALAVEHAAIRHEHPKYNKARGALRDHRWPHGWDQPRHVAAALPSPRPAPIQITTEETPDA